MAPDADPRPRPLDPRRAVRAQVIERWNDWVRVRVAETGEERWVDLSEVPHERCAPPDDAR